MQYHHHRAGSPQCDPDLKVTLESTPLQYDNYVICCQPVNGPSQEECCFLHDKVFMLMCGCMLCTELGRHQSYISTFVEVGGRRERNEKEMYF